MEKISGGSWVLWKFWQESINKILKLMVVHCCSALKLLPQCRFKHFTHVCHDFVYLQLLDVQRIFLPLKKIYITTNLNDYYHRSGFDCEILMIANCEFF